MKNHKLASKCENFTLSKTSSFTTTLEEFEKGKHWTISEFGGSTSALILLYLVNQKGIDVFIKESSISPLHMQNFDFFILI